MTDLDRIFGPVAKSARCAETMRETVEEVVQLAVEIAREPGFAGLSPDCMS